MTDPVVGGDSSFLLELVIVLLVFGGIFWFVVKRVRKEKAAVKARLPLLAQVVQGMVQDKKVTGQFQGVPAEGAILVQEWRDSEGDIQHSYYWASRMPVPPGPDWRLLLKGHGLAGMVGLGAKELEIECKDPNYKARLIELGLLEYARQVPMVVEGHGEFNCHGGWLSLSMPLRNEGALPEPAVFQYQLQVVHGAAWFCTQPQAGR